MRFSVPAMSRDLMIGLISLAAALVLLFLGLPNRRGESLRFLRFYAAPMIYPAIILIFLGMGVAELITWAAQFF
jgi:hypothetical protein